MWVVKSHTRDYEDTWAHVVAEFDTEAEAEAECERLEFNNPWFDTFYTVSEE